MKYLKTFENSKNIQYILCVKEPHVDYFYKYTKGKKYKIYSSNLGIRIKDDNGKFDRGVLYYSMIDNGTLEYSYVDAVFTTDNSIENYEFRKLTKKFNI